jgi:hypothetical protein
VSGKLWTVFRNELGTGIDDLAVPFVGISGHLSRPCCEELFSILFHLHIYLSVLFLFPPSSSAFLFLLLCLFFFFFSNILTCKHYRSWLRHYATTWKVASSIPDEVIGFFNLPNPSCRTTLLELTEPLKEMSARNLPGGKVRPACA